jgi:hypothetical protein
MDANRFDTLTRHLAAPTTRRATLGAALGGGLLSALGLRRAAPEAAAAQGGTCVLDFAATVRLGPSLDQTFTDGAQPGELRGELSFALSGSGALQDGALTVPGGVRLPVVGQATGNSLQLRIELAQRVALVAIGVGERDIAACQGAVDGLATGPGAGDLGDWHAAARQQGGGAGSGGTNDDGGNRENRGNRGNRDTPTPVPAPEQAACASGLTRCGNACVDLATDRNHCGACGEVCPGIGGLVCAGGRCGCPAGWADCSEAAPQGTEGYCADLGNNPGNCGACGVACAAGQTCANGQCQGGSVQCGSGLTDCGGICVDLLSDLAHCGACGAVCESGLVPVECRNGICERANCPVGITYCGAVDGCRDLTSDPNHCGACQNSCGGDVCMGGICGSGSAACPAGQADCGEGCTDLGNNDFHCGVCGNECADGQFCQGGVCIAGAVGCDPGLTDCGGICVDLSSDLLYCGDCAISCVNGQTCQGGVCVGCPAGLTDCGGLCVDLLTDAANCGACGIVCPQGPGFCVDGLCPQ